MNGESPTGIVGMLGSTWRDSGGVGMSARMNL